MLRIKSGPDRGPIIFRSGFCFRLNSENKEDLGSANEEKKGVGAMASMAASEEPALVSEEVLEVEPADAAAAARMESDVESDDEFECEYQYAVLQSGCCGDSSGEEDEEEDEDAADFSDGEAGRMVGAILSNLDADYAATARSRFAQGLTDKTSFEEKEVDDLVHLKQDDDGKEESKEDNDIADDWEMEEGKKKRPPPNFNFRDTPLDKETVDKIIHLTRGFNLKLNEKYYHGGKKNHIIQTKETA